VETSIGHSYDGAISEGLGAHWTELTDPKEANGPTSGGKP
jgi:hypothetical protein